MRIHRAVSLLALSTTVWAVACCQGGAALDKLLVRHTPEEVDHMRHNAHYRYAGELLFYSASFLIEENGLERAPTEEEIAGIDLHAYDAIRMLDSRTGVHDPLIDKHVILLGRDEFEHLVIVHLSEADRAAYQASKNAVLVQPTMKMP